MSTPAKLQRLKWLRPGDGVKAMDYDDLQRWLKRAGPTFDTSVLCDLDRERIDRLHNEFFEPR